ncbi:MAG: AraC family transcriptional regulator [Bacteroidales bacterium]|nr:AraC family transcriptional regulator [Bacteroidales bacterium]
MERLRHTYCRYDMVCDNPEGGEVEIVHMPDFFKDKPAIETSQRHVHPFYEVIWFKEGEGKHYVDFDEYLVAPNTVFFIAPGQVHSFDGNTNAKGYVMKICNGLLSSEVLPHDSTLLKYNVFNAHDSVPYMTIKPEVSDTLTRIVGEIEHEQQNVSAIGHSDYLRALIKMLIIEFERSFEVVNKSLFSTSKISHKSFLIFRRDVEHNFRKLHSVKEYAELLNVSTKTLANYVSECSQFTPLEIINNRIILEAKRILRYSDAMLKEVAYELGFDDPSYFIKFFKRQVGCTPAEYRSSRTGMDS